MKTKIVTKPEADAILSRHEGHFFDFKSKRVQPAKLSRALSAFANAEGGEVYIGIEDPSHPGQRWDGFYNEEQANGIIGSFQAFFPEGEVFDYSFIKCPDYPGLVLSCEIIKNQFIWKDTQGDVYLRKGAQSLKQDTFEKQERLQLNKGITSYEDSKVEFTIDELSSSEAFASFKQVIIPVSDAETWLRKQKIIKDGNATVAGLVLFAD